MSAIKSSNINVQDIPFEKRQDYNQTLLDFESLFSYPLGMDHFRIDHGDNYFKFFNTLGQAQFCVALENQSVIGVCVAVLKDIGSSSVGKVWYLCDLKVHPLHQRKSIASSMLNHLFLKYSKVSSKIYAVSMNSANSSVNNITSVARQVPSVDIKIQGTLEFYLLSQGDKKSSEFIDENKQKFISLAGVKDLILNSTGMPLKFVHYMGAAASPQERPFFEPDQEIKDKQLQFMVCCPPASKLSKAFKSWGLQPMATGSVVANFQHPSWDFIKSCDI